MHINGIDHIQIVVKDRDRSLSFYQDVLGLAREEDVDCGDHLLRYFRLPGGQRIELNEYLYKVDDRQGKLNDRGAYRHCALCVSGIFDWERRITEAGYTFHIPVQEDQACGVYSGLLLDPNGVEIELIEPLK